MTCTAIVIVSMLKAIYTSIKLSLSRCYSLTKLENLFYVNRLFFFCFVCVLQFKFFLSYLTIRIKIIRWRIVYLQMLIYIRVQRLS